MLKTDMTGRVAVIVGSGGALDKALIKAFHENGAKVALCCKPEERPTADEMKEYADTVCMIDLDLLNFSSIQSSFRQVIEKVGKVDILVNNPIGDFKDVERVPMHEINVDAFVKATDKWFKGMLRFAKLCTGNMAERKGGTLVNIMSIRGITAVADQSIPVAVSAGIHGMTRMWGVEMRDYNIRANGIAVGVLEDDPELPCGNAVRFSHGNIKRPCTAEEAANTAVFLASDSASYITGAVLNVDGGITAGYARSF